MTVALQNNDLAAVEKFQNAETATHVTRARRRPCRRCVRAAGQARPRARDRRPPVSVHQFDATFENGVVHETIQFDPDNKVVHFKFDPPHEVDAAVRGDVRRRRRGGGAAARRRPSHARRSPRPRSMRARARACSSRPRTCSAWARSNFAAPTTGSRNSTRRSAAGGVVAFSSGNHAQGVALAAQAARHAGRRS